MPSALFFIGHQMWFGNIRPTESHCIQGYVRPNSTALVSRSITITTLVENTVNVGGLSAEHGLSFLLRTSGGKMLFDTGQTGMVVPNASKMGIPLTGLDAVALSHGHYDHTGGLSAVETASPGFQVFLHPAATEPKFTQNADGSSRSIGLPASSSQVLSRSKVTPTHGPTEILPGVFLTGEIPRKHSWEDTGGRFFLDAGCTRPDPLLDDQALYIQTREGTVIILGCAHAGVVNTVQHVLELTSGRPIHAIIGGMHLLAAPVERIQKTVEALLRWKVNRLYPAHCTGMTAIPKLISAFPNNCSLCPVGTSLSFECT